MVKIEEPICPYCHADLTLVTKKKPDLVVLDLVLPAMGGLVVLKELKANPATREIPLLVLSNVDLVETVEAAVRLGAASYLLKTNYDIPAIVTKIQDLLAPAISSADL